MDFPNSPTLNQPYSYNGKTWKWNGDGWELQVSNPLTGYTGATSITTLGTVITGNWQAGVIGVPFGGTGLSSYTAGNFLYAVNATTLGERTPSQVLVDIGALAASSYTASDLLAKLLTVDGVGSLLDADLLDGQQGSYYMPLTGGTPGTGDFVLTLTGNQRLRFTGAGGYSYIQAGDPSPDNTGGKLRFTGYTGSTADEFRIDANAFGIYGLSTGGQLTFGTSGSLGSVLVFNTQGASIANNGGSNELMAYAVSGASSKHTFYTAGTARGMFDSTGMSVLSGNHTIKSGAFASNQNFGLVISTSGGEWVNRLNLKSDAGGVPRLALDVMSDNAGGTREAFSVAQNGNATFFGNVAAASISATGAVTAASISVTSNTLVSNLNADLLDGQHGTYYLDLTNATGTLNDARLPSSMTGKTFTGAVSITAGVASTSTTTGSLIVTGGVGISGALNASTKSFMIPHPTKPNKNLRYGSLEGPEFGVYVRGRLKDTNVIELPDYWCELVDEDSISVQLTPIGKAQKLFVENVEDGKVYVRNGNVLSKKINCFYIVFGERKDVNKLEVESDA